jgi:bifunctional non-homologous end joining protein LigD
MPTRGTHVPNRPEWLHEIKHDGYRLIVQREGKCVRLFTRVRLATVSRSSPRPRYRNRQSSFVIDGEAVLLGVDGRFDFNGLHSRQHDEVQFYAFDMLVSDGDDIRNLPLTMRKASLARRLARRADGIFLSDFEQEKIGPDLSRHACLMGLEGLVSKRADSRYRSGRSPDWVKARPPASRDGTGHGGNVMSVSPPGTNRSAAHDRA